MGKRSRDLFSLLEEREQGKGSDGGGETRRRRNEPIQGGLWASVRQWFAPQPAGGRRARAPAGVPGVVLAAVGLACLGVGFGLGRWLPRAEAGSQDLASRPDPGAVPGAQPRRPGPLESTPGQLSPEKEAEILSNQFFVLLQFAAPQAEEAARAAAYLRAQGVETVRARKFQLEADTRTDIWAVIAYVVADDRAGTLSKLKAVPPSRTWQRLAARLQQLQPSDAQTYDPANG